MIFKLSNERVICMNEKKRILLTGYTEFSTIFLSKCGHATGLLFKIQYFDF